MKISVGIPTIAGRQRYLASALKTCVTQDTDDLEIVVSDNSEGDAREVVESLRDSRIRYVRPERYLPMSAHWDFMVAQFTGDLVTIIGDDDGLMPGSLQRVCALAVQFPGLPIQHSLANYCWPDFPEEASRDKFWFIHAPGDAVAVKDSREFLSELGRARAAYVDGPMLYHNFVPGPLVRRLLIDGSMFHRASPDVYTAVTIAAHTSGFVRTQEVLTLAGQGARANGAAVRDGRGDGQRFVKEMQASYTPRFTSVAVQLQTLDSILEARERYGLDWLQDCIDAGEQFCQAANECLDIPDGVRRMRELVRVARDARRDGRLGYLLSNRGARLFSKAAEQLGVKPTPASDEAVNRKRTMPASVKDVYAASLHVQQCLRAGRA